jgi:hypothetical protein
MHVLDLATSCHCTNTDRLTNPDLLLFLIHSQLIPMPLAKDAAVGAMLKLTSLVCPLLSLPLVSPKLSLTTMLFTSGWKKLTAN